MQDAGLGIGESVARLELRRFSSCSWLVCAVRKVMADVMSGECFAVFIARELPSPWRGLCLCGGSARRWARCEAKDDT